ncbi:methyl-viologen-reducing hydrogenase, delta subunit, partial [human gut metagenome]
MFILRAFEKGADGVIMCGCHPGDCHYSTGNYYARRRMTLLFSMLDFIGVENGRTRVEWVSAAEGVKFSQTMNEFVGKNLFFRVKTSVRNGSTTIPRCSDSGWIRHFVYIRAFIGIGIMLASLIAAGIG